MTKIFLTLFFVFASLMCLAQTTEVWTTKAPTLTARHNAGAAVINNILYVIGGSTASANVSTVEAYNPATNTWTTKTSMPTARGELGVAAVNGKIYAIGGYYSSALNTVEEYDPSTNTWSTKASMPTARSEFSVGVIGNNIYAVGGWPGNIATLEVYNTVTNTWATKTPVPTGRNQNNGCIVINGKLHFIGGKNNYNTIFYANNDIYDTLTDTWSTSTNLPFSRFAGATVLSNNRIYYFGGSDGTWIPNYRNNTVFDSTTNTWLSKLQMLNKRSGMIAVTINRNIYVIGGYDSLGNTVNWNQEYFIDNNPVFLGGTSQSVTVCQNSTANSIDSLMSVNDLDTGQTITWSVLTGAVHGTVTASYSTTSTGGTLFPVGLIYTPTSGFSGIDSFTIQVSDSFATTNKKIIVTVNPLPTAGTITGITTLFIGNTVTLSDSIIGGIWSANNSHATVSSSGIVTGVSTGIDTIRYTVTNSCGIALATHIVTVNTCTLPVASIFANSYSVCIGLTDTLSNIITIGQNYGGGKVAYILQPGDPGYSVDSTKGIIAAPYDQATEPSGTDWGCYGATFMGTSTLLGTGISNTDIIIGICGTGGFAAYLCDTLTIGGFIDWYLPSKDELNKLYINKTVIGGFSNVFYWSSSEADAYAAFCQFFYNGIQTAYNKGGYAYSVRAIRSFSIPLITDGTWSSSDTTVAIVDTNGVVNGVDTGIVTISYTVSNSCGSSTTTKVITVTPTYSLPCYIPTVGLIAWYPFTGNANDSSGNGHNGTVSGATLTSDRFGNANSAYLFNGASGIITNNISSWSDSALSFSFWIKPSINFDSTTSRQDIIAGDYFAGLIPFQVYYISGNLTLELWDSLNILTTYSINQTFLNSNWYFITITASVGSNVKFQINNTNYSLSSTPASIRHLICPIAIGYENSYVGPFYFNGKIDDIGIWNRTLLPCEISKLYNSSCEFVTFAIDTITGGSTSIFTGASTTFADATTGGTWSVSNTHVSISSGGIIIGVSSQQVIITL